MGSNLGRPVLRLAAGTRWWYHSMRQDVTISRNYKVLRRCAAPRSPRATVSHHPDRSRQETHQRRPDAAVGGLGSRRRRAIRKRDPGQTIVYLNGTAVPDPFKRTLNCGGAHTPLCIV